MDVSEFKEVIAKAVEQFAAGITANAEKEVKTRLLQTFGLTAPKTGKPKPNGKRRGRPPGSKNAPKVVAPPTPSPEPVATKAEAAQIVKEQKRVKRGSNVGAKCLDPDCDGQPVLAKGLCRKHYYQHRREKAKEASANGAVQGSAPATA